MSTELALLIATAAHANQFDKFSNEPYILHPIAVAADPSLDDTERCIALLHDVYEDAPRWIPVVESVFHQDICVALNVLSHDKQEPYSNYVTRCCRNPRAKKVKIADVRHNLGRTLAMPPSPTRDRLESKYTIALEMLRAL